jgi:hypothetical protein
MDMPMPPQLACIHQAKKADKRALTLAFCRSEGLWKIHGNEIQVVPGFL